MAISLADFVSNAPLFYLARQNNRPMPALLLAPPGAGKSDHLTIELPARLEEYFFPERADTQPTKLDLPAGMTQSPGGKVIVISEILSTREPMDIRGYMFPLKNPETGKHENTYLMPDIARKEQLAYELGAKIVIINFDELTQCDQMTQKAASDTILNGRLGDSKLSDKTWIVAAGNRQQDGAGSGKLLSLLNNRITTLEVFNPVESFLAYLKAKQVPQIMQDFADFAQSQFASITPTKDGPFLSNRSYMAACNYVRVARKLDKIDDPNIIPDNPVLWSAIAGTIGESTTHELRAFIQAREHLPKPEEILRDPEGCKLPPDSNIAAHYAASRLLASMVTATNVDTLWKYAMRLRRELVVRTANTMMSDPAINNVLFNAPTFMQWQADPENRALVQASMTKV